MPDAPAFPAAGGKTSSKKKAMIIGGIAVVGGGIGILYFRHKGSTSSSSTSTDSGIDPNTGVPYSQEAIDPNTGVPYADEAGYNAYGSTPGLEGTYNPMTGQYTPGLGTASTGVSAPASNAIWAQAAIQQLVNDGYDPVTASTAIGLYLAGTPLTSDQYDTVQAALGLEGQPPQGAPTATQITGGGTGNSGNGSTGSGGTTPAPQPTAPNTDTMRQMGIANFGNLLQWASQNGFTVNGVYKGNPVSSSTTNNPAFWHYPVTSISQSGKVLTATINPT